MSTDEKGFVTREKDGRTIITVDTNSIDYRNCETFKSAISTLVSNEHNDILLNLEAVSFMDSAGLGVILFGKRTCEGGNGSFSICNVQGYVTNLFKLTNMDRAIRIFPNEEVALASLKPVS